MTIQALKEAARERAHALVAEHGGVLGENTLDCDVREADVELHEDEGGVYAYVSISLYVDLEDVAAVDPCEVAKGARESE